MNKPDSIADHQEVHSRPSWGTGWEAVLDHEQREIRMRFRFLGLPLPLKRSIPYSDVVRVSAAKEATSASRWRYRISGFEPMWAGIWHFQRRGGRPHVAGWTLHMVIAIREKKPIRLRTTFRSPRDAKDFARQLGERMGVPRYAPQPAGPQAATASGMCRYHPDAVAEYECAGCHRRFCSKCVREVSGEYYCRICAARLGRDVKHRDYKVPLDMTEEMRRVMKFDPYAGGVGRQSGDTSDEAAGETKPQEPQR